MPFVGSVRGNFGPNDKRTSGRIPSSLTAEDLNALSSNFRGNAAGGNATVAGGYIIHTFLAGTQTFSTRFNNNSGKTVEYLVVAGGGSNRGAGAGGVRSGSVNVSATSNNTIVTGSTAQDSSALGITSTRGGEGGACIGGNGGNGGTGGSGGGAGRDGGGAGSGTAGQGFPGGGSGGSAWGGMGGGGGAGGPGGGGGNDQGGGGGGGGGGGLSNSITGSSVTYAGGSGGCSWTGPNGPSPNGLGGNVGNAQGNGVVVLRYLL